jgi:hypothetical protein
MIERADAGDISQFFTYKKGEKFVGRKRQGEHKKNAGPLPAPNR